MAMMKMISSPSSPSSKPRWRSPEFVFIYAYSVVFYYFLFSRAASLSSEYSVSKWKPWLPGLRPGWLFGHQIDASDSQWSNFRKNLPILTLVMFVFTILSKIVFQITKMDRIRNFKIFILCVSILFVGYLHGTCVIFIFLITTFNFILSKCFAGKKRFPFFFWTLNCFILFLIKYYDGFSFKNINSNLKVFDNFRGAVRWNICFNLTMLKILSFGIDFHWTKNKTKSKLFPNHLKSCLDCNKKKFCYVYYQENLISKDKFTFFNYLIYIFYYPLFIAGPIITFNSFISQIENSSKKMNDYKNNFIYFLRWTFSFIIIEFFSHFFYFNALAKSGLWKIMSPIDVCIIGYGVLNFMWLKFLLIWRFFRFWSLIIGINCPENINKCVNNNYDFENFWKNWHSSFNIFLVRYLYLPLGGRKWKFLNIWVIFTFVAFWHDLELKLFSWAWLTCFFLLPEILSKKIYYSNVLQSFRQFWLAREVCAIFASVSICALMCANLVGFVIGISDVEIFFSKLLVFKNAWLLFYIFFTFYLGAKLMFEFSEMDNRRLRRALEDKEGSNHEYSINKNRNSMQSDSNDKDNGNSNGGNNGNNGEDVCYCEDEFCREDDSEMVFRMQSNVKSKSY